MKKVLIGILALIMALGMVGCSQEPAEETKTPEPAETVKPTQAPSRWTVDYTQDEFGDDTDNAFVVGKFSGQFSNTATAGSDLTVYVYYMKGSIGDNYLDVYKRQTWSICSNTTAFRAVLMAKFPTATIPSP